MTLPYIFFVGLSDTVDVLNEIELNLSFDKNKAEFELAYKLRRRTRRVEIVAVDVKFLYKKTN